jgi:hypothetical protein
MVSRNVKAFGILWAHYYRLFGARAVFLMAYRVQVRVPVIRKALPTIWWRSSAALSRQSTEVAPPKDPRRQEEDRRWFAARFPAAREQKLMAAERICQNQFSFLGTGMVAWGDPIDWHRDVKSGHRWPTKLYSDYGPQELMPGDGVDVKIPWELSRLQQLVTLGQVW